MKRHLKCIDPLFCWYRGFHARHGDFEAFAVLGLISGLCLWIGQHV